LLKAMYAALVDMVDSGFLSAEEKGRMAIPTVARSREDFVAPFGAEGRFGGLRVKEVEVFLGTDHIWLDFERHGDAQTFGARWSAFSRASVFPTLAASLIGGRDDPRAAKFIERLETDVATRLAAMPERMLIPLGKVLIAKEV
jgi:hypothetical protein